MTQEDIIKELEAMQLDWQDKRTKLVSTAHRDKLHVNIQAYNEQMMYSFGYKDCINDLQQLLTKIKQQ